LEAAGHFPSGAFRGYKADIWEGGHRVPFIVRWPGQVKAGTRSDQTICLTDLMATCAEVVKAKLPDNAGEDSFSILPALLGTDNAPLRDATVHHSLFGDFAIRQGKWKLELCADSGGWTEPTSRSKEAKSLPVTQLYDLSADAGESLNIQADNLDVVARMTEALEKLVANGRSTPGAKQTNDAPVQVRKDR
jgi:arylsulfatase A